jgi:hypothetical protein
MRLQELFETTEEDRALVSLSSSIYDLIKTHEGNLGKIGDLFDTPITALNDIGIIAVGGDEFAKYTADMNDTMDYADKQILGLWDEDVRSIIFNKDHIDNPRMQTTVTHELRHALDDVKSGSYPNGVMKYFTPKKKEHRKNDPHSTIQYRARPAEINARFLEVLHKIVDIIPKRAKTIKPGELRDRLFHDIDQLFIKYEIDDIFPERTKSKDYKRLLKRAYNFVEKELTYLGLD